MSEEENPNPPLEQAGEQAAPKAPRRVMAPKPKPVAGTEKKEDNKVVKLLEKNPLGMTLPEMAGGTRQLKKIRMLRPQLAEALNSGLVMPISQRAGHTVYKLVKHMGPR
ncbi:MAG: hypothetical protein K2Y39_08900 [Candidatus Obscuribacterales bacterium]|nr:hypothetical protein [Candidatus Obscuribacterales bacterium]